MKTLNNDTELNLSTNQLNFNKMKTTLLTGLIFISLITVTNNVGAQDKHGDADHSSSTTTNDSPHVELHENSDLGNCDFDISSDLTQSEWKRANKEIGNIIYLSPLSSSKPLGVKKWDLTVELTESTVDEESGAWNNTFAHPDSSHYLIGSGTGRLAVPGFRFRMGVTKRLDLGIYYAPAQPFGANYGFLGLEGKYSFINDTITGWAASARLSYVQDANINDFNISVTGLDIAASKTFLGVFTPYAGLATNWNYSRERTNEVNLKNESHIEVRGILGAEVRWKFFNLGYEIMLGDEFNNRSLKVGVTF